MRRRNCRERSTVYLSTIPIALEIEINLHNKKNGFLLYDSEGTADIRDLKKMDNAAFVAAENQLFGVCSSNRMSVAVKTVISVDYI